MAKVYILTEGDFSKLRAEIARNPEYGKSGNSSQALTDEEKEAFAKTHRFYKYIIEKWIDSVRE